MGTFKALFFLSLLCSYFRFAGIACLRCWFLCNSSNCWKSCRWGFRCIRRTAVTDHI